MKRWLFAGVLGASLVLASAAVAATVFVTPSNMHGWTPNHDSCGAVPSTGSQGFVNGPGDPPGPGTGSYAFTTGVNGDSYETLRQGNLAGTKLADLTALSYSTYVSHFGSGGQAVYIDLKVDVNGDGVADDTLTFEPIYQTGGYSGDSVPNQGQVVLNTWQTWDALHGGWWTESSGTSGPPLVTLAHYVAQHPNAQIVNTSTGGFRLSAGCGGLAWTNFAGNADNLTIGVKGQNVTYNFELSQRGGGEGAGQGGAAAECKNGGWRHFTNPSFKNQGQCVSFFVHQRNAKKHEDAKHGGHHKKGHGD